LYLFFSGWEYPAISAVRISRYFGSENILLYFRTTLLRLLGFAVDCLMTTFNRSSGVLLHPSSFPGRFGIGTLGFAALEWIDWLSNAGQKLWQVLPLGHTGYGDSPYQSFGAFAGNPLLIDLELLEKDGFLPMEALQNAPDFPQDSVDYGWIYIWKWQVLRQAAALWQEKADPNLKAMFGDWRSANASWLEDYALFMACKNVHGGNPWNTWKPELVRRDPDALELARLEYAEDVMLYALAQYWFFSQWGMVRRAAHAKGIKIIGDIPIFVAHDSSDVWANQHLFALEPDGSPSVVAGVPPDYFSATGQLWGNPHYRFDVMAKDGFAWWLQRFEETFKVVDVVRVDHFRGFEAYWEVSGKAETAIEGQWVKAPGVALFEAVRAKFGDLAIIAEDLGVITKEVEALRDGFNLPGMKILQFAFYADTTDPFLPHNYTPNCVVYTGTHDNDTTLGWWAAEPEKVKAKVKAYLGVTGKDIVWDMIRAAWASKAVMALAPLQDLLELGGEKRMNLPGTLGGTNWAWRYSSKDLTPALAQKLKGMTISSKR
jgi:4-alpha-glucanotransferase